MGMLPFILSLALQFALVVLSSCGFSTTVWFRLQSLRDGVTLVFGGNYFARGEFVLYINHSGKYIEINFNMKIPF